MDCWGSLRSLRLPFSRRRVAVGLNPPARLLPINGIRLASIAAGIPDRGRDDLALIEICDGASVAAVFTRNAFRAAPVTVAQRHLERCAPRYLLINAGNANAGTGDAGLEDATSCCRALAGRVGCASEEVLPFSTGVIGQRLRADRVTSALPAALERLAPDAWSAAAAAIMTTDTVPKGISRAVLIGGKPITLTGIAKGSGMIRPDMGTMLAFVATDASVPRALLKGVLQAAVEASFNRITVDGDTSTNDACVLMATGKSSVKIQVDSAETRAPFQAALNEVMTGLAEAIVRDGEGATKFITIDVRGAVSVEEARQTAFTIAHSPLVKTAFFASDPNWGRILAAVGRAGIERLEIKRVEIFLDEVCVVHNGVVSEDYTEAMGRRVMARPEIAIRVDLHRGGHAFQVWTTDLSYDYVRINAEYRS
jgi:glutamate N-acetyltransferase/amino-acid N-acetyltransferase